MQKKSGQRLITSEIDHIRDLIAYRIVISMPKCHMPDETERKETELKYLYEIANMLPDFLERMGFSPEFPVPAGEAVSERLSEAVRPYFKDYIHAPSPYGYQSLHIRAMPEIF